MMHQALHTEFADLFDQHLEPLLRALVEVPSVNPPGGEAAAAKALGDYLSELGVDSTVMEFADGRANLVSPASNADVRPTVALCSHLDVVSPGPWEDWSSDPFTLLCSDGLYFGRGVCDAKGPVAVMALVAVAFERHLPGRVALAAVAGEELGGVGSQALLDGGFRAGAAIIGEPSDMRVARAHKGRIEVRVLVRGVGGHAAMDRSGPTAAARLATVIDALDRLDRSLRARSSGVAGNPSAAITDVRSAEGNFMTVPGWIEVTVDRRLIPGETHEEAAAELQRTIDPFDGVELSWRKGAAACELEADHALVIATCGADADRREAVGFPATCDQYIWDRVGIPSVVLGPGELSANNVHGSDEHIARDDLLVAGRHYTNAILDYLDATGERP